MKVWLEGTSPSRWLVESATMVCMTCDKLFNTREFDNRLLRPGSPCQSCASKGEAGELKRSDPWLVDLVGFIPVGECACPHFSYNLKKKINEIPPGLLWRLSLRAIEELRCDHIKAVREFSMNLTLRRFQEERMIHARGQTETNQP